MQELYRARICPTGAFTTKLTSDTLFGAFCWSYRYRKGEEALENLLGKVKTSEEVVIFSNAFPAGTLPMPTGLGDTLVDLEAPETKKERKLAYQKRKVLKNAKYIRKEYFEQVLRKEELDFDSMLVGDDLEEATEVHNIIGRETGVAEDRFQEGVLFPKKGLSYDVYILSDLDEEELKSTVRTMFLLGIGSEKSTGKGGFELVDWQQENTLLECKEYNGFMALSNFVPAQGDPVDGTYKAAVKCGKLDREYNSLESYLKKPVLLLQAGAIFKTDNIKPFYGKCLDNIAVKPEIVINAYTIALPVKI